MGLTRITSDGITDGTISTADLADQSVTLAKLPHGTSSNNGKFLRANVGADPTFETIDSFGTGSLVGDQAPQLGGDLASNGNNINMADDDIINVGSGNDLRIRHNGLNSLIEDMGTGNLQIRGDDVHITGTNDEILAKFIENTGVELYHDGSSKKFETTSGGVSVTGSVICDTNFRGADNVKLSLGDAQDLEIYHNGTDSIIAGGTDLLLRPAAGNNNIIFQPNSGAETLLKATVNGAVELYYDNGLRFETTSEGVKVGDGKKVSFNDNSFIWDNPTNNNTYWMNASNSTFIDVATGGKQIGLTANGTAEAMINCYADGAVELYHNGIKKLETTTSGISVTGAVYSSTGVFGEGTANNIDFTTDNRMGIHINGSEEFRFESDGDFHADGDVYAFSTTIASDENLKDNITTITDAVAKVEAIKGVTFKWKENNSESAGVIAQDVEKILPEVVRTVSNPDGNSYKAVNYGGLTSILIEAIKDLSARIKVLEAK